MYILALASILTAAVRGTAQFS